MRGADSNGQRVASGTADKFLNLFRTGVAFTAMLDIYFILNTGEGSELSFDDNAMIMRIFNDLAGQRDVFLERFGRSIDHNRSKAAVDAVLAEFKSVAVVKVKRDRNVRILDNCGLYQLHQVGVIRVSAGTLRHLQNNRASQLTGSLCDALDDLHIVHVECADRVSPVVSLSKHLFCCYKRHFKKTPFLRLNKRCIFSQFGIFTN